MSVPEHVAAALSDYPNLASILVTMFRANSISKRSSDAKRSAQDLVLTDSAGDTDKLIRDITGKSNDDERRFVRDNKGLLAYTTMEKYRHTSSMVAGRIRKVPGYIGWMLRALIIAIVVFYVMFLLYTVPSVLKSSKENRNTALITIVIMCTAIVGSYYYDVTPIVP